MANSNFYSRLKKLFSSNVVVRNIGGNRLKVVDSAHLQTLEGNPYNLNPADRYKRLYGSQSSVLGYNPYASIQANRLDLYTDYEAMDEDAIVASALDIYADECTTRSEENELIVIKSDNENIKKILDNLFYDILNIDFNLWSWIRNLCKYGDFFLYLDVQEKIGIVNVVPLSTIEISREEGTDPENMYYTRFMYEGPLGKAQFESFQVAHFRLLSDTNFLPYGRAILEPARKLYKQYTLMEDAMMIHRLTRSAEKRIFKIDVGDLAPNDVDGLIEQIKTETKRTPYVNERTGQWNIRFDLNNLMEDYYVPVRGQNSGTTIETLPGLQYDGITDVEYLQGKLFAALKIPKAFLGYDEGVEGKSTLASEDIRFARTIDRIQRIVISELTKIAIVHLYSQGFEDADLINFDIELTSPSIIYEQEKITLLKEKVQLARDMVDSKLLSRDYIHRVVFKFTKADSQREQNEVVEDAKTTFRLQQIENEGNDPALTNESYGTPHDLASMHTNDDRMLYQEDDPTPEGGWEGAGRPPEGVKYGTDKHPRGRDPLGKNIGKLYDKSIKHDFRGGSPLAMESAGHGDSDSDESTGSIHTPQLDKLKTSMESVTRGNRKSKIISETMKTIVERNRSLVEDEQSDEDDVSNGIDMLDESNLIDEADL